MPVKGLRNVTVVAYALALSVWSGVIAAGSGGSWVAGAVPVAGWVYVLARFGLWGSWFALMVALWLVCAGAAVVLRSKGALVRFKRASK